MNTDVITQALSALQTQGSIYQPKLNIWKAVSDPRITDKLQYGSAIACPQCGKPTTQFYLYDDDWMCVDCLNARQHQNDDEEV